MASSESFCNGEKNKKASTSLKPKKQRPGGRKPKNMGAAENLLCVPASQYARTEDVIPFHIPHKTLLKNIEYKEKPLEPLTGFSDFQKSLTKIRPKSVVEQDESEQICKLVSYETRKVSADLGFQCVTYKKPCLAHSKLPEVVDQKKLIIKMRQKTDGSFVYLAYAVPKSSELYTPYALKIVNYDGIVGDVFLTMSAEGVLQHIGNEMIFTPLDKWEAEYDTYCTLMQIQTFAHFRMWKAFYVWRKNIIFSKFNTAQTFINNNLFILNPILRNNLLKIQLMCFNMTQTAFTVIQTTHEELFFYFIEKQMEKMELVKNKINDFRNIAKDIIQNACYGALLAQGFVVDERLEKKDKKRSFKGKEKGSYIEQASKRKFCLRLAGFITLVDYMMISMLIQVITNSLNQLIDIFEKHSKYLPTEEDIIENFSYDTIREVKRHPEDPQVPMLTLNILLEPIELIMDPPYSVTEYVLTEIFNMWENIAVEVKSFVADPFYNPFITPVINGKVEDRICGWGPTAAFFIKINDYLIFARQNVFELLNLNYTFTFKYLDKVNFIWEFYKEDCAITDDDIKNERGLEKFRSFCTKFKDEIHSINSLSLKQVMGLFMIEFEDFKEVALPLPMRLLKLVEQVIPWLGKTKVDSLVTEAEEAEAYLKKVPETTEDFVNLLEYIESASDKVDQMELELEYCKELYDIAEEFHVPYAPEDMSIYLGLSVTMATLRNLVDKKIEEYGKYIKDFNTQINKDISATIAEAGKIKDRCMEPWLYDIESNPQEVMEYLNDLYERLIACQESATHYKNYQKQFRSEITRFDILDEVMNDVKLRILLWESVQIWESTIAEWYQADFGTLDVENINTFITKNVKNVSQLEKGLPKNLIVPKFKDDVELMKDKLPVISYLRNPALRARHWMEIEKLLNHKFKPDEEITLEMLEKLKIFNYPEELLLISGQASSEAGLEILLKKVEESWESLEFIVLPHKDAKNVYILGSLEEVQLVLDESHININTIASSRHVGPIKSRVEEWINKLDLFSRTLDEWTMCQQSWIYLEVIFSAPDIQRQLPNESKMFLIVDKSWKDIMRRTQKMPLAIEAALQPNLYETFQKNNTLLEQIMKCLESYLETKRVAFPRFYFLSNDELLDILAQTRNPHAVQPHLRKCFDAIAKLEFGVKLADEGEATVSAEGGVANAQAKQDVEVILTTDIIAMISPEGERVPLGKGLKARGNVEDWLGKVEESMFLSLRRLMKMSLTDYMTKLRTEWVLCHSNQIVLAVSQIMWARGVHEIFNKGGNKHVGMQRFEHKCIADLNNLAVLIRSNLPPVTRKILIALITIDVHARDTVHNMVANRVQTTNSFDWLKVLRYYWEDDIDDCVTRMSSAQYIYGYEYLGAGGVLVITPLTDRCYLCLMGALQLDLGGAPAGPAGTGKTETTKDLAKALAIQCVVFNCSEGLDFKMMGRFFSGLAQSGAWCCFDEFNRIDIEVLSVIAQQLITIRNAKAAKLPRFMFEGREIKLVQKCAAFITMNPGYAGRTELPDNLKALFRPISMMVPDYALIAEVILYSEGFESSKNLSQKMVQMYKLCSEQLSQQDHYDFGMRAVKSVLVMAGALKRANPDRNEDVVLICALRDSNLPKFLADDAILFTGILGDLFPGIELPIQDYGVFQETIVEVMEEYDLQPEDKMISKIIQLYETMIVRWGVMLVGPTGGGKSTILNSLGNALARMAEKEEEGEYYAPVHKYIMNPKAVSAGELYGEVNTFTMEWRDGLMGIMVRTAVKATNEDHQWIICDGPVDAVWIENLNTVLDDNKMLCLANSERIKLTPYVHMVFEVMDLAQASPATVSRCGMVYVDADELKWLPYVKTWLHKFNSTLLNDEMKEYLLTLFETYVEKGFVFIKKKCKFSMNQVEVSKVTMLCALIESHLNLPGAMEKIGEKSKVRCFLCQIFIFSYFWSLGGNLIHDSREKFEGYVKDQFDDNIDARLPGASDLIDIYMNVTTHKLEPWVRIMPPFVYDKTIPFFETLVPTIDTVRFGFIIERMICRNYPVLITGDTGVGKSVTAKAVLDLLQESNKFVFAVLNFSAQTSSARTQEMVELKLERKKKTLLGAPVGKKLIIFVDDVNMPKLETYGAQPPVELLRQLLDYGGLYDREKLFWKDICDVILMTACAPPGGGRNPLTPRFMRHFGMLLIPPSDEFTLKAIFKAILRGFLSDFCAEIRNLADFMINAAVDIYLQIATDLLPTPAKSHYVFNLRDLSKCVQGITQGDPGIIRDESSILRLFYHECLRVFHDRLINVEDKSYFYFLMKDVCSKNFGSPVLILPDEPIIYNPPPLLFGDFMAIAATKENRFYEEITNFDKVKTVLQDYLDDYNLGTSKEMQLIFFMDAVEHCVRIARILRSERGNALLVGVGGMGKQSLTKLSSHLNGYQCFQIELTRNYDHESFGEDLRLMYSSAGIPDQNITFLFTDTQIVQEEFLEDINNILNSGEVPNLFESDELEKVIIDMRDPAKAQGILDRDGIFNYFIKRVRKNLHLVVCMSPIGDAFRRRCRMFPSLVNCCTIDWFEKWPREALLSVAKTSLQMDLQNEELCHNLSIVCVEMHESVEKMTIRFFNEVRRHYYTTPSSYLELIKLYRRMLKTRQHKLTMLRDRIQNGLTKLYETNEVIDAMKETLIALEPELAKKSVFVAELMKNLEVEKKAADKVRVVVKADEAIAKTKAEETQLLADDAQRDLDTALPALEAATKALQSLNKNDINELKVFQKPPKLVQFVMEAICLLLGSKIDWASAKLILGDTNFLKRLQDYDRDHISEIMLKKLKTYVEHPDFTPEKIATVSKVCKSMCMWVRAMDMYAKVYKVVEPKRKKLKEAENELNEVMTLLREKQKKLADVEAMIADLENKFDTAVADKAALEYNMELTSNRLNRAGRLNVALGDEQIRWEIGVKTLSDEFYNSVGDVAKAAACVAYLGAFTGNYREELIDIWDAKCKENNVPGEEVFSLVNVLADPYVIRMWNSFGLPRDKISIDNAILLTEADRWPLMIDPQEQANRWIKLMEATNGLKIIKLTDPNYMRYLEIAIRLGTPVLLEEIGETLDPTLGPILLKQTFLQGGRLLIHLGDSDVEYDSKFRFYITTKLSNPHYLPEICIKVTIVNFTVTASGLEDQLLAEVVRLEQPELEEQRSELIVRINSDKTTLKNIEDKILHMLYHSEGNILDNEILIESLNESKETSAIIAARLLETETTEEKISIARERYRPIATRGSVLYFVVAQLAEIDPMYQYSLKYFKQIFNIVTETSEKSDDLETRLNTLHKEITLAIYTNVSRGLFEKHKLVFSFMLCAGILREANLITDAKWDYLLRGPIGSKVQTPPKPDFPIVTDAMWQAANFLAITYKKFKTLPEDILNVISVKIGDYNLDIKLIPSTTRSKTNWNNVLDDFEKLMLIKTLKEEKLVFAITKFVGLNLGQTFIESPQVSLQILYQDTSNIVPLIFVLSTGSDPFGAFQRFAADMGFAEKVKSISLGQGQGPVAEKLIHEATEEGHWVFLQNCHLATSWMLAMEKIILTTAEQEDQIHKDYRLYLSSMPSKSFPVSVLQNSVKVTNEPPKGLRANVKRAFTDMLPDFFENHPLQQDWRTMLFGLCMFHAVVQERKKFGPLGWNIIYEFNDSDREFAFNTLKMYCEVGYIPWDALEYLTGEITYGGRVTDYWDLRCLKTILDIFFSLKTLDSNYVYSASGTYYCPQYEDLNSYRNFIDNLPIIEDPEIFGMHENANIAYQIKETQVIILTIMESQPRAAAGAEGKSSDEIVYELADTVIEQIVPVIPVEDFNLPMLKKDDKDRLPSLTTVLLQEIDRYNILLKLIHSSMKNLKKATKGLVVMSDVLEEVYTSFLNNQVPKMWSAKAYNSLKSLGSWIRDLILRLDFIYMWVRFGHPTSYWLPGFYFPQGFLTGTLQTHARKYNLPIDELKFDFSVQSLIIDQENVYKSHQDTQKDTPDIYKPLVSPGDGVIVHGIFIDAGRWHNNKLVDALPGEVNPPLPAILLKPKTKMPENDPRYVAPLYKTSVRAGVLSTTGHSTNFVIAVLLNTDEKQSYWILKGTALLTQITD